MAYYSVCSKCGANLDPGEMCDCETERTTLLERKNGAFEELGRLVNTNLDNEGYEIFVRFQEGA